MVGCIEFQLFAPRNEKAALRGCFSDWQDIPMTKDERGYFRVQVELEDGTYQYKFHVQSKSPALAQNEWIEVTDPYATEVVDDQTQNGIVRIKEGQRIVTSYAWQYDDKPLPGNEELVIYEMHVADFGGSTNDQQKRERFKQVTEKLDYLSELGVNAIELMPVNEYSGTYQWGYKVRYFFAVESSYGSPEDLQRLIDECHARGMRVILDGIYNHTDEESPLLLIDRDYWYYHDVHYPDDPDNYWGPEFNYDHYDEQLGICPAWEFIGEVVRFWIQEYHIDGIRYDAVRQLGNNDFFQWITQETRKAAGSKPFYNIAEHIPENPDLIVPKGPMDGCWHESFRIFVLENVCGEEFKLEKLQEVLDPKRQGYSGVTSVVNYLGSHDREHFIVEMSDRGLSNQTAFQRIKLAIVLQMTAIGVPMLWMGDEFGTPNRKSQSVTQPNPLQWSLLDADLNHDLFTYYKRLISLRTSNLALQADNIDFFYDNPEAKVIAYQRWNDQGARVVVVANFSNQLLEKYKIPNIPVAGTWQEWMSDVEIHTQGEALTLDLSEYEAKVFVLTPAP